MQNESNNSENTIQGRCPVCDSSELKYERPALKEGEIFILQFLCSGCYATGKEMFTLKYARSTAVAPEESMDWIKRLKATTFESSAWETEEFKDFYLQAKRELTKLVKPRRIIFYKGHFDFSGFIQTEHGRWFYFSIDDVRDSVTNMLIRTAKSDRDFTGGKNCYIPLDKEFGGAFLKFIQD